MIERYLNGQLVERLAESGYVRFDGGVIVEQRPLTADEAVAVAESAVADSEGRNRAGIETAARSAIAANRDFLSVASPSNAQAVAQVRALTRQNNGIIRLLLGVFDGTD